MNIKRAITHNLLNMPGWRTKRHIVVIESDDWGSIRMPSKEAYNELLNAGVRVDKCHYCSNDSVASDEDLSLLFDVLNSVRDKNGTPAIITANAVVANPDFVKIRESGFEKYYFKTIDNGLSEITGCERALAMWREGNEKGFFRLQSHGREHLNVSRWMHYLQDGYPETRLAFDLGVYGLSTNITSEKRKSFLPAFDFENEQEEKSANDIAVDGLRIFEALFGFKSESFIAPNYTWGRSLEQTLAANGVKYLQGSQISRYCNSGDEQNKRRLRAIGSRQSGLVNLARNAMFEPAENPGKDWVDSCLRDMSIAFRWGHPAIVCSHRVNYIGTIDPQNRDRNLRNLKRLLSEIAKRWPDVEFMSSDQLGRIIETH